MDRQQKKDHSISMVRLIAMCFIITCHIMQYLGCELAWWFNVGVQMFLCISGYLYGSRKISNEIGFYGKSFSKILLDYYVVVIPVIGCYYFFANSYLTAEGAKSVILLYDTIYGGGHLWFVPVILLCYFLTPFYGKLLDWAEEKGAGVAVLTAVGMLLVNEWVFYRFLYYFHPAWMNCYLLGFLFRRLYDRQKPALRRTVTAVVVAFGLGLNLFQIWVDYVVCPELNSTDEWFYNRLCEHGHTFLGVILFLGLRALFACLLRAGEPVPVKGLLRFSDRYSYDIYLVHQFLILGPLSLMALTPYYGVNVVVILVAIVGAGVCVNKISEGIRKGVSLCQSHR